MEKPINIKEFMRIIKRLPEDEPKETPGKWYLTQREHWLGWLSQYNGPGAYGRKGGEGRDARFAYNHIVCPEMLLYLVRAIPLRPEIIQAVESAYESGGTLMAKSGAIRKVAPWSEIYQALWADEKEKPSFWQRLRR